MQPANERREQHHVAKGTATHDKRPLAPVRASGRRIHAGVHSAPLELAGARNAVLAQAASISVIAIAGDAATRSALR
jgi:hypothetical protein